MQYHYVHQPLLAVLVLMLAACGKSSPDKVLSADDVAEKHHCYSCHAVNKKVVGPAWVDISRKYKGDNSAAAKLGDKITNGGSGVWGVMPMPPTPLVSDAEKKLIVDFILGLEK